MKGKNMNKNATTSLIHETGVIAIMRARSSEQLIAAADALKLGGVRAIEVTMTTPGALEVIAEAKARYGLDIAFGVGSVLDAQTGRAAILAGADFVVSPILDIELIRLCNRYGVPVMPGCYSPTEVVAGWEAGADFIKLFPASVGGPDLIKAILAPFPQVQIVPVGGVNLDTASDFIRKGSAAIGVGSSLVSQALLDAGDMDELSRRAAVYIEQVKRGRGTE